MRGDWGTILKLEFNPIKNLDKGTRFKSLCQMYFYIENRKLAAEDVEKDLLGLCNYLVFWVLTWEKRQWGSKKYELVGDEQVSLWKGKAFSWVKNLNACCFELIWLIWTLQQIVPRRIFLFYWLPRNLVLKSCEFIQSLEHWGNRKACFLFTGKFWWFYPLYLPTPCYNITNNHKTTSDTL